jgi:hypothetical protein
LPCTVGSSFASWLLSGGNCERSSAVSSFIRIPLPLWLVELTASVILKP